MGIASKKLEEFKRITDTAEKVLKIQNLFSVLYESVLSAFSSGKNVYPTGNKSIDDYLYPLFEGVSDFRFLLEQYEEFIKWPTPVPDRVRVKVSEIFIESFNPEIRAAGAVNTSVQYVDIEAIQPTIRANVVVQLPEPSIVIEAYNPDIQYTQMVNAGVGNVLIETYNLP